MQIVGKGWSLLNYVVRGNQGSRYKDLPVYSIIATSMAMEEWININFILVTNNRYEVYIACNVY